MAQPLYNIPSSREPIANSDSTASRSWWRYWQSLFQNLTAGNGAIKVGSIEVAEDNSLIMSGQTSDAGAHAATLTNAPAAGDPAFWLRIKINGTNYAVPVWPA